MKLKWTERAPAKKALAVAPLLPVVEIITEVGLKWEGVANFVAASTLL